MKELKNLKGAKTISKSEQQAIKGGKIQCDIYGHDCPPGYWCDWYNSSYGICVPERDPIT